MSAVSVIKQRFKQVFTPVIISASLILATASVFVPQQAQAAAPVTVPCSTNMSQWDWPRAVQQNRGWNQGNPLPNGLSPWITGSTNLPEATFGYANSSWLIIKDAVGLGTDQTMLIYAASGHKLSLSRTSGGSYEVRQDDGASIRTVTFNDKPLGINGYTTSTWQTAPLSTGTNAFRTLNDTSCASGKNLEYGSSWDVPKYTNNISYEQSATGSTPCATLDVACKVDKAFDAVADTLKDTVKGMLNFIGDLFIPDSATIKASFDNLTTQFNDQMGFLAYPVTYLDTLFDSFSDTSNDWCNASTCKIYIPPVLGSSGSYIDIYAFKTVSPSLWTYMTLLIRAMAIFGFVMAMRAHYIKIASGGNKE